MTYFEVDVKIEVIYIEVRDSEKLELHESDLPCGRYGFLKAAEFCRSGEPEFCRIQRAIYMKKTVELAYTIQIRI